MEPDEDVEDEEDDDEVTTPLLSIMTRQPQSRCAAHHTHHAAILEPVLLSDAAWLVHSGMQPGVRPGVCPCILCTAFLAAGCCDVVFWRVEVPAWLAVSSRGGVAMSVARRRESPQTLKTMNPKCGRGPATGAQDGELKGDLVSGLRARVEGMQRIALKVQNVLDEIASALERGLGVATWADPNASALFLLIAIAGALAVATLGLHTVLAVALCWLVRACFGAAPRCVSAQGWCVVGRKET